VVKIGLICLLSSVVAGAGDPPPVPPVMLYAGFQQPAPAGVVEALRKELDNILEPAGLHFAWRSLAGVTGSGVSAELAVLTFKGRCTVDVLAGQPAVSGALGWTHISDGVVLPFADVDCDRIRLFLQRELLSIQAGDREQFFGRAVARVVAHELYHVFVKTTHHASHGICKSAFTPQDLLSGDFRFGDRDAAALKTIAARTNAGASDRGGGTL
jgi:hypothetical protein